MDQACLRSGDIEIHLAKAQHLDAMARLHWRSLSSSQPHVGWRLEDIQKRYWDFGDNDGTAHLYAALVRGKVVGAGRCRRFPKESYGVTTPMRLIFPRHEWREALPELSHGEIETIYVDPAFQGSGIGRALLVMMFATLAYQGMKERPLLFTSLQAPAVWHRFLMRSGASCIGYRQGVNPNKPDYVSQALMFQWPSSDIALDWLLQYRPHHPVPAASRHFLSLGASAPHTIEAILERLQAGKAA